MRKFVEISAQNLYKAVYDACFEANVYLPRNVYKSLKELDKKNVESSKKMAKIFSNAAIAAKNQRPLCQDTGQVVVFVKIGENVVLDEQNPQMIINRAVGDCYKDNCFRKSVVDDALEGRKNTDSNTPAVIYVEYSREDNIRVDIMIKGGGSENMSSLAMLAPSTFEADVIKTVADAVNCAGENACPPMFLGVGIGGTADYACVLSKKAFFNENNNALGQKIKKYINENLAVKVADVRVLSAQTHIACLPVGITINCHSARHASVLVDKDGYKFLTDFEKPCLDGAFEQNSPEIFTNDIESLKKLNPGDEILLSGTVYTARDMAHKRLFEMIEKGEKLPFSLENSIIFYAGPCPKKGDEVIGPVGPTTSKRMDKFAPLLYDNGLFATIGKGPRSQEVKNSIEKNNAAYFSVQGGVASLLQNCVKGASVIAFEDLGAEAVFKLNIEKLPLKVELK